MTKTPSGQSYNAFIKGITAAAQVESNFADIIELLERLGDN